MSTIAQTITIIGGLGAVLGFQTAWILRAFAQIDRRLDRLDVRFDHSDEKLDQLKTEIVRDHGERIARLEERIEHTPQ